MINVGQNFKLLHGINRVYNNEILPGANLSPEPIIIRQVTGIKARIFYSERLEIHLN